MRPLAFGALALGLAQLGPCGRARQAALADAGPPPSRDVRIEAAVCGGRPQCWLVSAIDAGTSSGGKDLFAAMVRLPERPEKSCTPYDVWSVGWAAQGAQPLQRLVSGCWTVDPTLRVLATGEVRFLVDERAASHAPSGVYRGSLMAKDFTLDPPRIVRSFMYQRWWDYRAFEGFRCDGDSLCEHGPPALPAVDAGDDFAAGGWRSTALGNCSMRFGDHARALLSRDVLYVEVTDDDPAPGAKVSIDFAPSDSKGEQLWWRLGLDGSVQSGAAHMEFPVGSHLDVVSAGAVRRFRLTGAWSPRVDTARLAYGVRPPGWDVPPAYLEQLRTSRAVCTPRNGVLEVEQSHSTFEPWEDVKL